MLLAMSNTSQPNKWRIKTSIQDGVLKIDANQPVVGETNRSIQPIEIWFHSDHDAVDFVEDLLIGLHIFMGSRRDNKPSAKPWRIE